MKEKYNLVDRSSWPPGPWDGEPDECEWTSKDGYLCAILRHPHSGHLCGYVGVEPSHPQCNRSYIGNSFEGSVHGGLTFSNSDRGNSNLWWFGFDCAHIGDRTPGGDKWQKDGIYRDIYFVIAECEELAKQIGEADDALARAIRQTGKTP